MHSPIGNLNASERCFFPCFDALCFDAFCHPEHLCIKKNYKLMYECMRMRICVDAARHAGGHVRQLTAASLDTLPCLSQSIDTYLSYKRNTLPLSALKSSGIDFDIPERRTVARRIGRSVSVGHRFGPTRMARSNFDAMRLAAARPIDESVLRKGPICVGHFRERDLLL